jgi:hypothetical protein
MGDTRNAYEIVVVKPEGKRRFGRPKHTQDDNIKTDVKEIVCEDFDWIQLAQKVAQWRALVNTVMILRVP